MKTRRIIYITIILTILFNLSCFGASVDIPKPTNGFFVNDFAGVIDQETEQYIQNIAVQLQEKTTAQVVVVTIDSLEGEILEEYAVKLYREWGIGTAEKNNGVLILVSIGDRVSRIEVGYGLEGALPDGKTGRIQDDYMIPEFQNGDYGAGIAKGFLAIVREVYSEYGIDINDLDNSYEFREIDNRSEDEGSPFGQIILVIFVIIVLILDWTFFGGRITRFMMIAAFSGRHRGGGSYRGGGGRGGGGFSGGGGRSGGGGSSRGW